MNSLKYIKTLKFIKKDQIILSSPLPAPPNNMMDD